MASRIYVAAGGGGDPIAAAMIAGAIDPGQRPEIATLAWERLLIDPVPGPRAPSDFLDLVGIGTRNYRITPATSVRAPAASTLPRLAAELAANIYLLDPTSGASGLTEQLLALSQQLGSAGLTAVDVGGDILGSGREPGLLSPLADALVLAAITEAGGNSEVFVAGPGLDGELSEDVVRQRWLACGSRQLFTLTSHTAKSFEHILTWHPSEATGLLWASAMGLRGVAELRDAALQVRLTDHSAEVLALTASEALRWNGLAVELRSTTSLEEAEAVVQRVTGHSSELRAERIKAQSLTPNRLWAMGNWKLLSNGYPRSREEQRVVAPTS